MKEIWKDIKGYEGLYQVSNLGNIKSLEKECNASNQFGCKFKVKKKEKILKQHINKFGYKRVTLYKDLKSKNYQVHRLVAEAFITNIDNLSQINHKDENKTNNNVDNLEWCSCSYNINYGKRNKIVSNKLKQHIRTKEHCLNLSKARKGQFTKLQQEAHKKQNHKIIYDGIIYESIRYAERQTGISRYLIKKSGKLFDLKEKGE